MILLHFSITKKFRGDECYAFEGEKKKEEEAVIHTHTLALSHALRTCNEALLFYFILSLM